MLIRFASAFIGIPLLVLLVFMEKGLPFILAVGLISLIGLYEFYRGVRKTGAEPQDWVGMVSALLFMFVARNRFSAPGFSLSGVLTLFVLVTLTIEMLRPNRAPIKNLGATFLGVIYAGWLFSYLVAIRSIQVTSPDQGPLHLFGLSGHIPTGAWLVIYVVFSSWAADSGAYLVGRKWGKHSLAPTLSPAKSWEGFIAGLGSAILMSFLLGRAMNMPIIHCLAIGIIVAVASVIGDLAESSIKRDIGIKDFGSILPGHGGILDRFDGLLFAAPIFFYYVTLVLKY